MKTEKKKIVCRRVFVCSRYTATLLHRLTSNRTRSLTSTLSWPWRGFFPPPPPPPKCAEKAQNCKSIGELNTPVHNYASGELITPVPRTTTSSSPWPVHNYASGRLNTPVHNYTSGELITLCNLTRRALSVGCATNSEVSVSHKQTFFLMSPSPSHTHIFI